MANFSGRTVPLDPIVGSQLHRADIGVRQAQAGGAVFRRPIPRVESEVAGVFGQAVHDEGPNAEQLFDALVD